MIGESAAGIGTGAGTDHGTGAHIHMAFFLTTRHDLDLEHARHLRFLLPLTLLGRLTFGKIPRHSINIFIIFLHNLHLIILFQYPPAITGCLSSSSSPWIWAIVVAKA